MMLTRAHQSFLDTPKSSYSNVNSVDCYRCSLVLLCPSKGEALAFLKGVPDDPKRRKPMSIPRTPRAVYTLCSVLVGGLVVLFALVIPFYHASAHHTTSTRLL